MRFKIFFFESQHFKVLNNELKSPKLRQPSWFNTKQFYNDSANTSAAYKTYLKFMTTNLNGNKPVDETALERMYELEKKIAQVLKETYFCFCEFTIRNSFFLITFRSL